jgi:hypothetical protein
MFIFSSLLFASFFSVSGNNIHVKACPSSTSFALAPSQRGRSVCWESGIHSWLYLKT